MKLTALSSLQVANYLQLLDVDGDIFMIADLPQFVTGQCIVVNIDPTENGAGTHWTAFLVGSSNVFYFDSFGAPPPLKIVSLARNAGLPIFWNNFIVQDINSDACGYYCVLFLYEMQSRPSKATFNAFVNKFHDNTLQNEHIVFHIFAHLDSPLV